MNQDGRGKNKTKEAASNKERVRKWFKDNPESNIIQCCAGLSLSYKTVRRCLNELAAGKVA